MFSELHKTLANEGNGAVLLPMFNKENTMTQQFKLIQGDVLEQLKTLPADYFDAVLSDPPYGISFMGKEWDHGVPSAETYAELLRVLKPGAMGLHFGGTRMWHRLAVNLEEAGFELRDTVMWLYGSGFPKSHNISKALDKVAGAEREVIGVNHNGAGNSGRDLFVGGPIFAGTKQHNITAPATAAAKQWDGWGTALKPAWEPALLVQKPLAGTFANNALTHGCGGLNIDGCRVGFASEADRQESTAKNQHADFGTKPLTGNNAYGDWSMVQPKNYDPVGRFPANLILDDDAAASLDATVGTLRSGARKSGQPRNASSKSSYVLANETTNDFAASEGGPSRFFYCAKVSTKERNAGCGELPARVRAEWPQGGIEAGAAPLAAPAKNNHPTLKPLALTEYLAKLLLVPKRTDGQPRRILVPFSGAGSEVIGALLSGWDEVWGIELNGEYIQIATARIKHHTEATLLA